MLAYTASIFEYLQAIYACAGDKKTAAAQCRGPCPKNGKTKVQHSSANIHAIWSNCRRHKIFNLLGHSAKGGI